MRIVKCHNGNVSLVSKEVEDVSSQEIKCNTVDASFEKHVPQFVIKDHQVEIFVNHVMEGDHYIEWILVDYGKEQRIYSFLPGDTPKVEVEYREGMQAYSYCNKHSLWSTEKF